MDRFLCFPRLKGSIATASGALYSSHWNFVEVASYILILSDNAKILCILKHIVLSHILLISQSCFLNWWLHHASYSFYCTRYCIIVLCQLLVVIMSA